MSAHSKKGFTLVELLVVIAIIAILSVIGITVFSGVQQKARDTKRKADLEAIHTALEIYYSNYGKYPPAVNSTRSYAYGSNGYIFSTDSTDWFPVLVPDFMQAMPQDPINNTANPWTTGNYSYSYGNVTLDGQAYDLTAQLENTSDPDRCGVKDYRYYFTNNHWCDGDQGQHFGGPAVHSNQIYERSPLSP